MSALTPLEWDNTVFLYYVEDGVSRQEVAEAWRFWYVPAVEVSAERAEVVFENNMDLSPFVSGQTYLDGDGEHITSATVSLNTGYKDTTLTHEIGHVLGLGHTMEGGIMHPYDADYSLSSSMQEEYNSRYSDVSPMHVWLADLTTQLSLMGGFDYVTNTLTNLFTTLNEY